MVFCLGCGGDESGEQTLNPDSNSDYGDPQRVTIIGYPDGDFQNIQEPFISRDGQYLFFNTSGIEEHKDLLYAEWDTDQDAFVFKGEIMDVNSSDKVEGNPTMDENYNFFYIDTDTAPSWVRSGLFKPDTMSLDSNTSLSGLPNIELSGSSATVNMGVEVSADGDTLYFSRAVFLNAGQPDQVISASDILFAQKIGDVFVFDEATSSAIMLNINTSEDLEYAACISEDELEFYFTRLDAGTITDPTPDSQIMQASRTTTSEAFGIPLPVESIPNHIKFVEAPTIYGNILYYHQFDNGVANLYKVTRQ
jgi:hypothetical protein